MFRILVAEDDDNARFLMCEVLRRAGYEPCPARDGVEALEVMEHYQCDLAVVDITMPRMDGITFTQTLREGNCDLPVLMVTARVTQEDKRRGFRAGTDDYMVKPVDEEEMLWRIEALLRRYCSRADRRLTVGTTVLDRGSLQVITPLRSFCCCISCCLTPGRFSQNGSLSTTYGIWTVMWTSTLWRFTSPDCERNSGTTRTSSCGRFGDLAIWGCPGRTAMARNKVKKEKPPVRLLGTMFLLVLGLVAVYVGMALGIFTLVQRLVHLEDASYTLLWPILILSVSAILGVLLAIFIFRGYLAPLSRLMQATQSVAEGDYTVRVDMRGARGEVAEYIRSFNKMAEELSSVALLRMDFVNTFSHEFKTPLISIRGFAKLLQNDDLTSEQRRTYTDTVVQQSERLAAMSTHVLELARYENTEIVSDKTLYSLDEQLRRCVRQQEREWLKKSLTVEGDLDPVDYYGNEELVEHIWSNLLSNAIRFTPAGGQITVVLRRGEGEITVSVSDTGIGMDEETQRHIFDRFYRAAPYPDDRGNGLGLSIVRRVVTLCGGRVTVFSRPGNGSTFTVTLPAEE